MYECPECGYAMTRDMDQDGEAVVYTLECPECGHFEMMFPYDER